MMASAAPPWHQSTASAGCMPPCIRRHPAYSATPSTSGNTLHWNTAGALRTGSVTSTVVVVILHRPCRVTGPLVCLDLLHAATAATVARDQLARAHIELLLRVDFPLVMPVATQGVAAVSLLE